MQDVIKGCKNHQHHDDRQANPEPKFLRPLRQWSASNRFDTIEQKVTTIEQRDGEQVQKPIETESTAVRWISAAKPAVATCPDT